ncbi:MAG: hypothetical protein V1913_18530 [Fibrobacterota bacterium]
MIKRKSATKDISALAFEALKEAVNGALMTHKRLGLPIYVEKDGKIITIPARAIKVSNKYPRRIPAF